MNIKLIADSTCDLPAALVQQHGIRIVPLSIILGDKVLKDGIEVTPKELFEFVESGDEMSRTSAVNVDEYMQVYAEERPNCDAIIHFIISSDMSSCYQNACIAAEDYDNIFIIDTRNLSTGMAHLVLDAAALCGENKSADEIHRELLRKLELLDTSFVIDTLTYLHKGGRCSAIAVLASGLLKIRPSIMVKDGKMAVGQKYRGKLETVLRRYVQDKLSDSEKIDTRRIFVVHTMTEQDRYLVEMVKDLVAETLQFDEIIEADAGCSIANHCGPNTLGIMFYRKP